MTLIVSWIQDDMVLQLSDRRLSHQCRSGRIKAISTPANKTVVWNGRVLFGFTGLAYIDDEPVDHWIARHIASAGDNLTLAIQTLVDALNPVFRRGPQRGNLLAVMACGFIYDDDTLKPFSCIISNGKEGPYSRCVGYEFKREIKLVPPGSSLLMQGPIRISDRDIESMDQRMTPESNQLEVVGRIAHLIRRVADKDPGVGHDLMLSALPIAVAARPHEFWIGDGRPNPTSATFLYMSKDGTESTFAPTIVMGGQVLSGFQMRKTSDGRAVTGKIGNFGPGGSEP